MKARLLRKCVARQEFRSRTYYRRRKKYAGLMPSELRRLKQLEEENSRLKRMVSDLNLERMVADLSLDKEMLQDVIRRKL